tara:strand:- start:85 stop:213 length:129 start_codon:yes stop_codon:yes gene_type:complete
MTSKQIEFILNAIYHYIEDECIVPSKEESLVIQELQAQQKKG